MQLELPDTHAMAPEVPVEVQRVGIVRVAMPPLRVDGGVLEPVFKLFVSLPPSMRGAHISRCYQALSLAYRESSGIEVCSRAAEHLLDLHEYSLWSEASMGGNWLVKSNSPLEKLPGYEPRRLWVCFKAKRGRGLVSKRMRVSLFGVTTCPCAYNVVYALTGYEGETHMQRALGTAEVLTTPNASITPSDLANAISSSMSSETHQVLKRGEEGDVVHRAISRRRFAEDVAREIAARLASLSEEKLPSSSKVFVRVRSLESIHTYDVEAKLSASVAELRGLV